MRVGLTGGIGSGKSAVARRLAARGAVVVDADQVAREIVEPGAPALAEIVAAFGPEFIQPDGTLARAALARHIFSDDHALARLNAITHPRIRQRSAELIAAAPAGSLVVYDMPLLVENGLTGEWDVVVVVEAPPEVRVERLVARGMDADDARRRMMSQATDEQRRAIANYVIDNSGPESDLDRQVALLWVALGGLRLA